MKALFFSWTFRSCGAVTQAFYEKGIENFDQALKWVHRLPYGRNSNRSHYHLIFSELRGTCSTKHAALAALALENAFPIQLKMAICKIEVPWLSCYFPEAHCYLQYQNQTIDVTFPLDPPTLKYELLEVRTITPDDIAERKNAIHQDYLRKWVEGRGFTFEEVWQKREAWIIQSLAKDGV